MLDFRQEPFNGRTTGRRLFAIITWCPAMHTFARILLQAAATCLPCGKSQSFTGDSIRTEYTVAVLLIAKVSRSRRLLLQNGRHV
jgi:hypothetical protein